MLIVFTIACFVTAWVLVAFSPAQTEEDRQEIENSDPWFSNED